MQVWWSVAVLCLVALAGCTDEAPVEAADDGFGNLNLAVSDTTGIVRGVVVDGSVVPISDVVVRLETADGFEATTDAEGRFAMGGVPAGTHFMNASHPLHQTIRTSVSVEAGNEAPPLVKLQMVRLFTQDAYLEQQQIQGYMNCGYSAGLSSPCILDYTQLLPVCPGGCVQELYGISGDVRRFVVPIGDGWQSRINEIVWEPSTGTSESLSQTISFFNRTSSHSYTGAAGPSPLRHQMDMDPELTHPDWVPPEGKDDYLVFVNPSASGSQLPVAFMVQQDFELFVNTFYYGFPPEGWSFVGGDEKPF